MSQNIVFLHPMNAEITERVARYMPPGFALSVVSSIEREHVKAMIGDADYAVVVDIAVDETLLRAAPKLKLLHKWGVGVDNLALDAARMLGIKVARTTGANATPVAEFTLGLMLGSLRGIVKGHGLLRQGIWAKDEVWRESFMLTGKTVGSIGFGNIGREAFRLLRPLDMNFIACDPVARPVDAAELGVRLVDLDTVLRDADFVTVNCPLSPATRHLVGARELGLMKRSAFLINTARGPIVDEAALTEALAERRIAGAALDVFAAEPTPPDNPLLKLDNVITTPHSLCWTDECFRRIAQDAFTSAVAVARGAAPVNVVNRAVLDDARVRDALAARAKAV